MKSIADNMISRILIYLSTIFSARDLQSYAKRHLEIVIPIICILEIPKAIKGTLPYKFNESYGKIVLAWLQNQCLRLLEYQIFLSITV